jgi:hypothetical protein
MRRTITAPVKTLTENTFRSMAFAKTPAGYPIGPQMQARATRDMHAVIAALLTQLPRPRQVLADGTPNRFLVRLTRVSPNYTDDDGLAGGTMKAVRDEVATWCGIDDGHERIRFEYDQQACRRTEFALRIEVEDLEPGTDTIIERGRVPERITRARPRGSEKPKTGPSAPDAQTETVFRECYAVLPHEQDGGDPVLSPLAMKGDEPPRVIAVRVPASVLSGAASVRYRPGSTVDLHRSLGRVEGRECWIYMAKEDHDEQPNRTRPGR